MIASGSPHTEVMKITGHTQLKTFLRYLNITPETARKVASNLDDYLAKVPASAIQTVEKIQYCCVAKDFPFEFVLVCFALIGIILVATYVTYLVSYYHLDWGFPVGKVAPAIVRGILFFTGRFSNL